MAEKCVEVEGKDFIKILLDIVREGLEDALDFDEASKNIPIKNIDKKILRKMNLEYMMYGTLYSKVALLNIAEKLFDYFKDLLKDEEN